MKTLNYLWEGHRKVCGICTDYGKKSDVYIILQAVRGLAKEWVKEEMMISLKECHEEVNEETLGWVIKDPDIQRWMKRFDLNESDLLEVNC